MSLWFTGANVIEHIPDLGEAINDQALFVQSKQIS